MGEWEGESSQVQLGVVMNSSAAFNFRSLVLKEIKCCRMLVAPRERRGYGRVGRRINYLQISLLARNISSAVYRIMGWFFSIQGLKFTSLLEICLRVCAG